MEISSSSTVPTGSFRELNAVGPSHSHRLTLPPHWRSPAFNCARALPARTRSAPPRAHEVGKKGSWHARHAIPLSPPIPTPTSARTCALWSRRCISEQGEQRAFPSAAREFGTTRARGSLRSWPTAPRPRRSWILVRQASASLSSGSRLPLQVGKDCSVNSPAPGRGFVARNWALHALPFSRSQPGEKPWSFCASEAPQFHLRGILLLLARIVLAIPLLFGGWRSFQGDRGSTLESSPYLVLKLRAFNTPWETIVSNGIWRMCIWNWCRRRRDEAEKGRQTWSPSGLGAGLRQNRRWCGEVFHGERRKEQSEGLLLQSGKDRKSVSTLWYGCCSESWSRKRALQFFLWWSSPHWDQSWYFLHNSM